MYTKRLSFFFIGLVVFSVASFFYHFGLLDSWQDKLLDRFFITQQPRSSIIIVAIDDESLNTIGQWPWKREVFAKTLTHFSQANAVGIDISFSEPSRYGAEDDTILTEALQTLARRVPVVLPLQLSDRGDISAQPLPAFSSVAQTGFVNIPLEKDNVARKAKSNHGAFSSFSRVLALNESSTPATYRIHYYGPAGTFTTIALTDVLSGSVPDDLFARKTVLLGATARDLHDVVGTPVGSMPGVEVHADSIQTIRDASYPTEIPYAEGYAFLFLVISLSIVSTIFIRTVRKLLLALFSLALILNCLALYAFSYNLIFPVLYLDIAFIVSAGLTILMQYMSESEEKKRIRAAFQYYLTPQVIDEILLHPEKLTLGGEKRTMTILFSDIVGFTTISEELNPIELTTLMNEYLTAMTDIITRTGGVVDKYIGDAVMAFWGAPLADSNQALHACTSARMMHEALADLNKAWSSRGISPVNTRIGIATGDVVVGNMGSASRFNYTVMGDTVNLASRFESLNKIYGTDCLVSETTAQQAQSHSFREIDTVRVKGKKESRTLFELSFSPYIEKQHTDFKKGYEAYRRGLWEEAIAHFTQVLALGKDGPTNVLLERAILYRTAPPPNWDGVYTFDTK